MLLSPHGIGLAKSMTYIPNDSKYFHTVEVSLALRLVHIAKNQFLNLSQIQTSTSGGGGLIISYHRSKEQSDLQTRELN